MKIVFILTCLLLHLGLFSQNKLDTIIINNYIKNAWVSGPRTNAGKNTIKDTAAFMSAHKAKLAILDDSLYYNGKGYFKTSERNYIIIQDKTGKIMSEGEYLDFYKNGIYIEYDFFGRKLETGYYSLQPSTKKSNRKGKFYDQRPYSKKVGTWYYYTYKNYLDKVGQLKIVEHQ
ncbi:MAG: hypothetical protein AB8B74_01450 [Crocinitomicaceae bacterium]